MNKLSKLETKIDKLDQRIESIEDRLVSLDYISDEVYYTANRIRFKPYLCDPKLSKDDLVCINNHEDSELVGCHRIVQRVTDDSVVVIHNGDEIEIKQTEVEKIGHSPALKYLVIQQLEQDSINTKHKRTRK